MKTPKFIRETILFEGARWLKLFRIIWILGLLCLAAGINSRDYRQFSLGLAFAVVLFWFTLFLRVMDSMVIDICLKIDELLEVFRQIGR